jgi:ubiquinone/menaquinone biosynthesis C-methylase UbiE
MASTDTQHFDQSADQWDADPVKVARAEAVAEAIRRAVPLSPESRAMEYGCGTGLVSFALRGSLGHITLADVSPGMLAVVARKLAAAPGPDMSPLQLDLLADPLPETRFELIYSLMTFHHIDDIDTVLARCHALLVPGGRLCVADLDAEDGSFHGADFDGHKGFDRAALAGQARRAGFADARFETVFHMHRPDRAGQRDFPLFFMTSRK